MTTRLSWLKSNAALYQEAKVNKDQAITTQSNILKDRILKVQTRDFPGLRDAFTTSKKEILSKENIQIAASGATKDTLTFTSPFLSLPKQKKIF